MAGLFGKKPDNSAQIAMQQKQIDMQEKQNTKLDSQERDQKAQVLARQRAAMSGGSRALMSEASLGTADTGGSATTLGSAQA